jgi:hypothetical protein
MFFYANSYSNLSQINEPTHLDLFLTAIFISGPVSLVAGVMLTARLELMSSSSITVIAGIDGLTRLLIAGYHCYEEKIEQYTSYLPAFSAAVPLS